MDDMESQHEKDGEDVDESDFKHDYDEDGEVNVATANDDKFYIDISSEPPPDKDEEDEEENGARDTGTSTEAEKQRIIVDRPSPPRGLSLRAIQEAYTTCSPRNFTGAGGGECSDSATTVTTSFTSFEPDARCARTPSVNKTKIGTGDRFEDYDSIDNEKRWRQKMLRNSTIGTGVTIIGWTALISIAIYMAVSFGRIQPYVEESAVTANKILKDIDKSRVTEALATVSTLAEENSLDLTRAINLTMIGMQKAAIAAEDFIVNKGGEEMILDTLNQTRHAMTRTNQILNQPYFWVGPPP
ncbi:MAG TPA: hypothetical protein VEF04_19895 [Blastocatellia bacterium]|nr:hypothetical protein [Blastocatellia bacterium]